ncbi:MAG: hypothetical protein KGD66_04650 [Candidatus Lokiarchaeota archaeon]|nr:hypothetical protein [Candidatus Lokiarchaeota archaeon]
MAQASLEVVKKQGLELQSVSEVELTEFIANKEVAVEKTSFGKRLSKLIKNNMKETRTIQEIKNIQNFRLYAIF